MMMTSSSFPLLPQIASTTTRQSVATSPPPYFQASTPPACVAFGFWRLQLTTPWSSTLENFIWRKTRSASTITWNFLTETLQRTNSSEMVTGSAGPITTAMLLNHQGRLWQLCSIQTKAKPSKASKQSGLQWREVRQYSIERFHMTSRRPCWCTKTKELRPYWCTRVNSIFMQILSFVSLNQYGRWSREWKRAVTCIKKKKWEEKRKHLVLVLDHTENDDLMGSLEHTGDTFDPVRIEDSKRWND